MPGKCGGKWIQLCSGNALRRRHQPERHLPGIKYKSQSFKRLIHKIPQGDSGGALTVDGILVGIVSRGGSERCIKVALISPDFILILFLGQYVWCLHWRGLLYALDQRNDFDYGRHASMWPHIGENSHCRYVYSKYLKLKRNGDFGDAITPIDMMNHWWCWVCRCCDVCSSITLPLPYQTVALFIKSMLM